MTVLLAMFGMMAAGIAYEIDRADADRILDDEMRLIAFYAGPTLSERPPGRLDDLSRDLFIQVRDQAGTVVYASDPDAVLPVAPQAGFADAWVGDARWRTYAVPQGDKTVQISQRVTVRQELARKAAWEAALPVLASIPFGWFVVGWGLDQMLGSLSRLSRAIAMRGVEARAPIALEGVPDEFTPLVAAMNALIERLQLSLEQQTRFLSDAAHELRTPLTALRLQIDLLRASGPATTELDAVLPELARGAGRASALIDQLLRMARYDAGERTAEPADLDLVPLVVGCMADFVALAESKDVDLGLVRAEPARMHSVERDVHLLVGNLIENAVRYTPAGGVVDVGVRLDGGRAVIEVADTGPGIPDKLLPRVFDRFFRAPDASAEGSGLGLAICLAIARRHGFHLTLANRPERGLIATVMGPARLESAGGSATA